MRRIALLAGLVTACATDRDAPDEPDGFSVVPDADLFASGGVTGVSREAAWQAACRAIASLGGLIRVDAKAHRVSCGDVLEVDVVTYPNGSTDIFAVADTRRGGDVAWETFWRRFQEATAPEAPPASREAYLR